MGRRFREGGFFLLLLLIPSCASASAESYDPDEIVILHTNDVHGGLRPNRPFAGGSASLATFVSDRRSRVAARRLLLLDGGDCYQGTPEGNESRGRLVVRTMNLLEYDLAVLGNHEWDHGYENLRGLVRASAFPWMAENLRDIRTIRRPDFLAGPRIIEVPPAVPGGEAVRIGIFGLTTEDLPQVTRWETATPVVVLPEIETARRAVAELERRGADLVVALTHIGLQADRRLVSEVPGIDLVVGGHSHTFIEAVDLGEETAAIRVRQGNRLEAWRPLPRRTPIVQAGSNGAAVGEVRFRYDRARDRISDFRYRLVALDTRALPPETGMAAFLSASMREIDERMNRVVGEAAAPFRRTERGDASRGGGDISSGLGNFLADALRREGGAQIAFQNQGGIRSELDSGPVTMRNLYEVSPFGNTIVTMDLSGEEIRRLLERVVAGSTSATLPPTITALEISGLTVFWDPRRAPGDRIVNALVEGGALRGDAVYRVATNSFLAEGGDNCPELREGRNRRASGRTLLEITEEAFSAGGPLTPPTEARWRRIP